jgi:CheY-like chemotaxis protein
MPGKTPLAGGPLAGATVLLVEDTDDSREMLAEFMGMFGLEVEQARSGNEAIAKFRAAPPSLVVSDIAMPDGDGLSLVRAIRALPPDEGGLTPAIAVSALPDPEEAILAGFHAYLHKPVDPVNLLDVIRSFLEPVSNGARSRATSTVHAPRPDLVVFTFTGHVSAADVQRVIEALVMHLERAPAHVVADLRGVVTWDPSTVTHAQRGAWDVRKRVQSLVLVGGPKLSRLLSLAAARLMGIPTRLADEMPVLRG